MTDWTVTPHAVEVEHLLQLADGTDDQEAVTALWRSERSWRFLVLRRLIDTYTLRDDATGPLPPIDQAWRLLVDADQADGSVTEEVLARPTVGLWAAYTIRRADRPNSIAAPLWTDVGYLHSIGVACAVRAGLGFEFAVAVTHGTVVLPTVGAVTLPVETGTALVRSTGGRVDISAGGVTVVVGDNDPAWHPPVAVEVTHRGIRLAVELLDRDPYRDVRGPVAPQPLSENQIEQWRSDIRQAWTILVREQPGRASSIAAVLRTLSPVPAMERHRPLSASGAEAFGGVLLSAPDDPVQLAMTFVHESQHNKLGALQHLLTLVQEDPSVRFYAPWRDDPRPLSGLLQGAYAFSGIVDFWRTHRHGADEAKGALAQFEFALWRRQTGIALRVLANSGSLTSHGERFVAHLQERVTAAQQEPVPEAELNAALLMAEDHRAMWRGHNVRLEPAAADALTTAWERGDPLPAPIFSDGGPALTVVARPDVGWFDTRAVLTRCRLAPSATPPESVNGATEPDYALIAGDYERARAGYLADLVQDPTNAHHWIGYALATDGPEALTLLRRPELILAVARHPQAHPLDPEGLVAWMAALPEHVLREPDPLSWRIA